MHNWNIFGARMNHTHTRTHKIHHGPNKGKATTFPLIVLSMPGHKAYTQMLFCPRTPKLGVLKFLKLGLPRLWRPITFCTNLWLKWSIKQSYILCRKFSNTRHLHASKLGRFLTFNGWKSNWQFDSWPFFWP